eukprot:TRINITY_DN1524_c0_g1_i3.p1 TRINITY_DN1524_c0_g1~~TRINITY_DN1524_c0_g1_i3.p1  ORF type:complete len:118 (+),score=24.24 TRINITY_DN1524_c0_g1_i3:83-436(+)
MGNILIETSIRKEMYFTALIYPFAVIVLAFFGINVGKFAFGYVRKQKRIGEIEDKYEHLRDTRRDLMHHMYWARENKEFEKMENLITEIEKLDNELADLKAQHNLISQGKTAPLKSL